LQQFDKDVADNLHPADHLAEEEPDCNAKQETE